MEEALRLGRELVEQAPSAALAATRFERALAGRWPDIEGDLVTVSYVLSELDEDAQSQLVADAMARGGVVVLAEPGAWRARRRVALEPPVDGWTTPAARVLRRPAKRKGLVELEVCRPDGTAGREVVSSGMASATRWRATRSGATGCQSDEVADDKICDKIDTRRHGVVGGLV